MEQKLTCETVRDLLPLYIEEMVSEQTKESVEEHLDSCVECTKAYDDMSRSIKVETAPEVKEFKKYLRKANGSIIINILLGMAALAIAICLIVNVAVDHKISWSLIVIGGIACAYLPGLTVFYARKNKLIKGFAVLTLCTIPLMGLIQFVNYFLLDLEGIWFWQVGLPVAVLWLAIIWFVVLLRKWKRLNIYYCFALLCICSVPSNILTNIWLREIIGWEKILESVLNTIGALAISIILYIIGRRSSSRK